jgi:hypothetical protein
MVQAEARAALVTKKKFHKIVRYYGNTYKYFTYNDFTYNINKCDIIYNGLYS